MSMNHDPELDDVLQDEELVRLGAMLRSTRRAEPPLDEAFRSALRRQLMQTAWEMSEGRTPWWRRSGAQAGPARRTPALAWAGAAAGVLLIASVVVFTAYQQPGSNDIFISSPVADAHSVQLQQPILVKFNQPMDHKSTEGAVQIAPATYVAFAWNDNTLAVQPTSGRLAPNTQYQVTIGPGAKTQSGRPLTTQKTITFVTEPAASPAPSPRPTPRPTSTSLLTGEHKVTALPSGTRFAPQWSADSTTIYLVDANGALESVAVGDGAVKVIVADGVSNPAIAPAGDRLAYVRGEKIQILALATGKSSDPIPAPGITTLGWAKDQLFWGTGQGEIFKLGPDGATKVAEVSQNAGVVSIAPDGAHAVYEQGNSLHMLDMATSKGTRIGGSAGAFLGWSPDATRILYRGFDATVVADVRGSTLATILAGDASWSIKDEILVGNDTDVYAVRPDGYGRTRLSGGTYHAPAWAPNGTVFAFTRGGAIWTATSTPLPAEPAAIDQASSAVSSFMNARLQGQADQAKTYLDDKGKQSYSSSGLPLVIGGDSTFSRFYVLVQEITDRSPDSARFVVRLVLTKGNLDVSEFEETLTLKRDDASHPFMIDQATGSPTRDIGKGAEVVGVEVSAGSIKVVFDSDLVSDTVGDGVILADDKGKRVGGSSTYANRTAVITGLELAPGATYKLIVLTTVQDVRGRNVASEYDLILVGPAAGASTSQGTIVNPPSPEPTPIPSPSPASSPSP